MLYNLRNMKRGFILFSNLLLAALLGGCASVPMSNVQDDLMRKEFAPPSESKSGIYVFRDGTFGTALTKYIKINGEVIGTTAPKTYFYTEIQPGLHTVTTESEFGENSVVLQTIAGENYFIRQYLKMGVFVGGSDLTIVDSEAGQKGVLKCELAKSFEENW